LEPWSIPFVKQMRDFERGKTLRADVPACCSRCGRAVWNLRFVNL
jgi:hypothetical protein